MARRIRKLPAKVPQPPPRRVGNVVQAGWPLATIGALSLLAGNPLSSNTPAAAQSRTVAAAPAVVAANAPAPLLEEGHATTWWFAYKFNSSSFPSKRDDPQRTCAFGGELQSYSFSQQYVYASSEAPTLKQGSGLLGTSDTDPLGATFSQIYDGSFYYVVWNDQFYGDPKIPGCGENCEGDWGHSKGLIAWNDAGDGMVLQVTTPSWPGAGNIQHVRKDGNTLGCVEDNDVSNAQHFFALKLNKDDVAKVLLALRNSSVATDPNNPQIVHNGGPAEIAAIVPTLGKKSAADTLIHQRLSSGIDMISKPSALHAPPWQIVSAALGGTPLRSATWWASPRIPSTKGGRPACWPHELESLPDPGPVEIAQTGAWQGKPIGLVGGQNHAKIGVSTDSAHPFAVFGDLNQQGALSDPKNKCDSSQNGRGGLFFIVDSAPLANGVAALIAGDTAPAAPQ